MVGLGLTSDSILKVYIEARRVSIEVQNNFQPLLSVARMKALLPYVPLDEELELLVIYCSHFDLLHTTLDMMVSIETTRNERHEFVNKKNVESSFMVAKIPNDIEPIFAILGIEPVAKTTKMDVDT